MEKSIELIMSKTNMVFEHAQKSPISDISKGRTIPQKITRCNKCGRAIVSSDEYEKVRKELHPSFLSNALPKEYIVL